MRLALKLPPPDGHPDLFVPPPEGAVQLVQASVSVRSDDEEEAVAPPVAPPHLTPGAPGAAAGMTPSPAPVTPETVSGCGGLYHVNFVRPEAGEYAVRVWLRGEPVRSSLLVHVRPGPVCVRRCLAYGRGLHEAVAAAPAVFEIAARDVCGNLLSSLHSSSSSAASLGAGLSSVGAVGALALGGAPALGGGWRVRFEPRGDVEPEEREGAALSASAEEAASTMLQASASY